MFSLIIFSAKIVIGGQAVNYCWISGIVMDDFIVYVAGFYELATLRKTKFLDILSNLSEGIKWTTIKRVLELSATSILGVNKYC